MKNTVKKIKEIIKGSPKEAFGTNPNDPWSAKYGIAEGALDQYLMARGINPKFISRETKISHAKSTQFIKWKQDHMQESMTVIGMTMKSEKKVPNCVPEEKVEEAKTTQGTALDKFRQAAAERAKKHDEIEKKQSKDGSGMSSAIDRLQKHMNKEETELNEEGTYEFHRAKERHHEKEGDKAMARAKSFGAYAHPTGIAARKKAEQHYKKADEHRAAWKEVGNMKEDVEQIDELKKSTLASYKDKSTASLKNAQTNRDAAEPGKHMSKGFADLHAKSDAIAKKRVKGLKGYLQRKVGIKPTSEDVWQDGQAPTQTSFDGANTTDNTEPCTSHIKTKSSMSKSARMIKSLYKHHGIKEELYDHEKEDKSVASYGKKPKMQKVDQEQNYGDNSPKAAAVLSGGKTLTGKTRDTLEIDPEMRKPTRPDGKKEEQK